MNYLLFYYYSRKAATYILIAVITLRIVNSVYMINLTINFAFLKIVCFASFNSRIQVRLSKNKKNHISCKSIIYKFMFVDPDNKIGYFCTACSVIIVNRRLLLKLFCNTCRIILNFMKNFCFVSSTYFFVYLVYL